VEWCDEQLRIDRTTAMMSGSKAFTIVELLIVIVIIAILAVITIIAFNGVQSRARISSLSSSLNQSKKKLELYKVDNASYPLTGNLASLGITSTSGTNYQYTSDGTTYCLTASTGGTSYNISETSNPSAGACSGQVDGAIITNLSTNPAMTSTTGWGNNNNTIFTTVKNVTITGHPLGLTKALRSNVINPSSNSGCLSLYDVDTLGNTATLRTLGAWVMSASAGYQARVGGSGAFTVLSPNTWTYVQSPSGFTGWGALYVQKVSGTADPADMCYATGAMSVTGNVNYSYADGNSSGWSWNGAANTSTSKGIIP
jgi:prepilin-type N-terminal cleavage/methylation domain-containing protein